LRQTVQDFDLIVVGDGCDDRTHDAVLSFRSPKITWSNLEGNSGSQSAPNNEGIRQARRPWIAYLGHDDIWAPDHLERLREVVESEPAPDVAVSGCVYHGPEGSGVYWLTGVFAGDDAPFHDFFPPSSVAHRRLVPERIGMWHDPRSVAAPVDCEFLLRAANAGLCFRSTGKITVHKFAAGHRYLSYLRPRSDEQRAMLRSLDRLDEGHLERLIETSRRDGLSVPVRYPDFRSYEDGRLFEDNRKNRGLSRPALRPLMGRTVIAQVDEPRGLDWYGLEHGPGPFRWSGPSPRPKILIPYAGGWVTISIHVPRLAPTLSLDSVVVFVEDHEVDRSVEIGSDSMSALVFSTRLQQGSDTILTLHTPAMFCPDDLIGNGDRRRVGVPVGDIVIDTLPDRSDSP
jgi:Glycosyl transferase family 2